MGDRRYVGKNATTLSYQNLAASFFIKHCPGYCKFFIRFQCFEKVDLSVFSQLNGCLCGGTDS